MSYERLETSLDYSFRDPGLLETALTHSSYKRENIGVKEDNERLEFIGDAVLDSIIGMELYSTLINKPEGTLTKLRSLIVCERSLARLGRSIRLNEELKLGTGERHTGGENKDSIIADAVEAVIGAMFVDSGYDAARDRVIRLFDPIIQDALSGKLFEDYKSEFQEEIQKIINVPSITYVTDREEGPDHMKTFHVHVEVNGKKMGSGSGRSKKEAGQNAAKEALDKLKR